MTNDTGVEAMPDDAGVEAMTHDAGVDAMTDEAGLEGMIEPGPGMATASGVDGGPDAPGAVGADASLLALVDRLAALVERSDLVELEVETGGTGLVLRKPAALAMTSPVAIGSVAASASPMASAPGQQTPSSQVTRPESAPAARDAPPPPRPSVKAPLTGIWYTAPSPGAAPYIRVGGEVAVGQVIGLIEAMKLFNEIKSDLSGRVVRVLAESGALVKAKQPLIEVEPL